ncbi:oligosaccharide flippase family protein [Vibrio sp. 10N.239.311.D11]|uniref:oligosaccharide flippase family protein n=1 Tax=Vibrio sp. 10N.239.311.D11 TaxID=3229975 RepID=UPI0035528978
MTKFNRENSFVKAFVGTAGVQIFAKGISLVAGIIFARALGPEDFGRYGLAVSVITVAVLPSIAGLPSLIVREIARYRIDNKLAEVKGMIVWSNRHVISMSVLSIVCTYLLVYAEIWTDFVGSIIISALILIPLKGYLSNQSAIINAFQRPELAQLPTQVIAPVLSLFIVLFLYFNSGTTLSPHILIYIQIFTHTSAVVFSFFLLRLIVKKEINELTPVFDSSRWRKSLLPFSLLMIISTLNNELATVLLGFLGTEEGIAYFRVALVGTTLLSLGLNSVNSVSGPKIAGMYKKGDLVGTQEILLKSVRISCACTVPFVILFLFFGEFFIVLLFGEQYRSAGILLSILCIGQLLNCALGSVGLVLNMTGNENYTLRTQLVTLFLTITLLVIFIPIYNAIGAAIAVSTSLICWNLIMAFNVYRLTGLKTWLRFVRG